MTEGHTGAYVNKSLPDNNPKTAAGLCKPTFRSIPPVGLILVGDVMQEGADKYGLYNWRDAPITASTYFDAMMRHAWKWWDRQTNDPQTNRHHLAYTAANCMILMDAFAHNTIHDDRPKNPGNTPDVMDHITKQNEERLNDF